jgi:hypothetical protein
MAAAPASPVRFLIRVVVKALLLFAALDLLVAVANPLPLLGRVSAYNTLLPGRLRLPVPAIRACRKPRRTRMQRLFGPC